MRRLQDPVAEFVATLPRIEDLRTRLAQNLRERTLIRQLLRLAEQKEKCNDTRPGDSDEK